MFILVFWPPDKFAPLSLTKVKSPCLNKSKSGISWHMLITVLYFSLLNGRLNIILFFIVSFNIHAFWGTYATVPLIFIFLDASFLFRTSKLFNIAFNKQVFPEPIGPTIPIKSPFSIVNFISFNNSIISISGISFSFFVSFTSSFISFSFSSLSSIFSLLILSLSFSNNFFDLSSLSISL